MKKLALALAVVMLVVMAMPMMSLADEALPLYNLRILVAGETPTDQQMVLDKVEEVTRDSLNLDITVDYYPWSDYQDKVRLMSAANEPFDIFLTFSGTMESAYSRGEALALDDLLAEYGQNLLEKIDESNWYWAKGPAGETIAIPAQYLKDGVYHSYLYRKDLLEKYGMEPLKTLDDMEQYIENIKANDPDVIPLWGSGVVTDEICTSEFDGIWQYGYRLDDGCTFGWWNCDLDDAFTVYNYYESDYYKKAIEINTYANENGWFASDYCAGLDQYSTFAAGKVAMIQIDYYHFNHLLDELKAATPEGDLAWFVINMDTASFNVDTCNNFAQISYTSADPARAIMFLDWIQADQANYDLWYYGIEGVHYTLAEDGSIVYPEGVDNSNLPYSPTPWYFRNKDYDRNLSSDNDLTKTCVEFWKNAPKRDMSSTLGFTFDPNPVTMEVTQIDTLVKEMGSDVGLGILDYNDFVAQLEAAGMPAVIAEMQSQLDAYRAANGL